jgi:hypothetical protein
MHAAQIGAGIAELIGLPETVRWVLGQPCCDGLLGAALVAAFVRYFSKGASDS